MNFFGRLLEHCKEIISGHREIGSRLQKLEESILKHFDYSEESKVAVTKQMIKLEQTIKSLDRDFHKKRDGEE